MKAASGKGFRILGGSIPTAPTMQLIDMHGLPFGLGHIWTQNAGYFLRRVTLLGGSQCFEL